MSIDKGTTEEIVERSGDLNEFDKVRINEYIVSSHVGSWKDTEWHHVAVSYKFNDVLNKDNEMRLFIDGIEVGLLKVNKTAKYLNNNIDRFVDKVLRRVTKDGTSYDPGPSPTDAEIDAKLLEYYDDVVASYTTLTFESWKNLFNVLGTNKYGLEPFSIEVDRGIEDRRINFGNISYSQIFLGSDINRSNLALSSLDDLRISRLPRSENQIRFTASSLNAAPEEVGITRLKMDFDVNLEQTTEFTFLRNNRSRQFEFEVEVLNDFGFPLDKLLITQLIQIIKPAHTLARVRFKDNS